VSYYIFITQSHTMSLCFPNLELISMNQNQEKMRLKCFNHSKELANMRLEGVA